MSKFRGKAAYKKDSRNRNGILLVFSVVALVMVIVGIRSVSLINTKKAYEDKVAYYGELIAEEEERTQELEEFKKYTQTTMYVEEVAKAKFGLVKDGEIVFMAE